MINRTIVASGAIVGLLFAYEDIANVKPMADREMALLGEMDFHCERLEMNDQRCGACDRMGRADRERCNAAKQLAQSDYEQYYRHSALEALTTEVRLMVERTERRNKIAREGTGASTTALR
ncbi:MAG: hypothetical protein NXH70_02280 [Hyphomonas sp.]|nr:hypothetical protein [Hyphomonas sp.]